MTRFEDKRTFSEALPRAPGYLKSEERPKRHSSHLLLTQNIPGDAAQPLGAEPPVKNKGAFI